MAKVMYDVMRKRVGRVTMMSGSAQGVHGDPGPWISADREASLETRQSMGMRSHLMMLEKRMVTTIETTLRRSLTGHIFLTSPAANSLATYIVSRSVTETRMKARMKRE